MRRITGYIAVLIVLVMGAACGSSTPDELPTVMPFPTLPPSQTPLPTPTASDTPTATPIQTLTFTPAPTASATGTRVVAANATGTFAANAMIGSAAGTELRFGPGTMYEPPLAQLTVNTSVDLVGISVDRRWYQIQMPDGQLGWVDAEATLLLGNEPMLSVVVVTPAPNIPTATIEFTHFEMIARATSTPPAITFSPRVQQIYQEGVRQKRNPRLISKVGDMLTSEQNFMVGYGVRDFDLGNYVYLQPSIDYFSHNGFFRLSLAAAEDFNVESALDIALAPIGCAPDEPPVQCEYSRHNPAFAFIMFGSREVKLYDVATFENYLTQIVDLTIEAGIVPILTTFPTGPDYFPEQAQAFNDAIRAVAAREQIPLIDLRRAASVLPHRGVQADGFSLSTRDDARIDLTGDELQFGLTLRNLLSLQTLENLRRYLDLK